MLGSILSNDPLADKRFNFPFAHTPYGNEWSMDDDDASGKTLTSFKVSTLLKDNPDIHKCLFVVDRKDLDRQTREEPAPGRTFNALN